jgi:hypothetical protein
MGTLKEDLARVEGKVDDLDRRLQTVEQRLAVVFWLLGIATAGITGIAAEVLKRVVFPS